MTITSSILNSINEAENSNIKLSKRTIAYIINAFSEEGMYPENFDVIYCGYTEEEFDVVDAKVFKAYKSGGYLENFTELDISILNDIVSSYDSGLDAKHISKSIYIELKDKINYPDNSLVKDRSNRAMLEHKQDKHTTKLSEAEKHKSAFDLWKSQMDTKNKDDLYKNAARIIDNINNDRGDITLLIKKLQYLEYKLNTKFKIGTILH